MIALWILWFGCGLATILFASYKRDHITYSDLLLCFLIFIFGPIGMLMFVVGKAVDFFEKNGDKVAFSKKKDAE